MATYKVLQDIEAEDKLIGPLTPRQCIYAAIAVVAGYISFLLVSSGAAFLVVFMLPFIGFGLFFAFPWTKEQSTEVWALARVRFALKPRKRIWDQNGTKNLVDVTAPITFARPTRTISESEVASRLNALANTIDSRGWAVKNVPVSLYTAPSNFISASDRLTGGSDIPPTTPGPGSYDSTDIFDAAANPLAGALDAKMAASASAKRLMLETNMANPAPALGQTGAVQSDEQPWYTSSAASAQPAQQQLPPQPLPAAAATIPPVQPPQPAAPTFTSVPVAANPTPGDEALLQAAKAGSADAGGQNARPVQAQSYSDIRTSSPSGILPSAAPQLAPAQTAAAVVTPMTSPVNPAILELANNNDLNIATIAREAQQISSAQHPAETSGIVSVNPASPVGQMQSRDLGSPAQHSGEVTVSLH